MERRKRQREILEEKEEASRKRQKLSVMETEPKEEETPSPMDEDYDEDEDEDDEPVPHPQEVVKKDEAADQMETMLFEKLNPTMVADLVIAFMVGLLQYKLKHYNDAKCIRSL